MADEDTKARTVISRKELARELRKAAYQRAKAERAKDPKFLEMKQAYKLRQREAYARIKEERKRAAREEKEKKAAERVEERRVADEALMKMVRRAAKPSFDLN